MSRLTGGQKTIVAGLLILEIPFALFFYPVAAIFAITGVFVPIAIVLMGVGTLPFSFAMKFKGRWQNDGGGDPMGNGSQSALAGASIGS
jgi:hypothetical protein